MENDFQFAIPTLQQIQTDLTKTCGFRNYRPPRSDGNGVPYFVCQQGVEEKVVKYGTEGKARERVRSTIRAYTSIAASGGFNILPPGLTARAVLTTPIVITDFQGRSYAERARVGNTYVHTQFIEELPDVLKQTIEYDPAFHEYSVINYQANLRAQYEQLATKTEIDATDLEIIDGIDPGSISADKSCLSLVNLSPDNIFLGENSINIVDPVEQTTFKGSPIMGLEQFRCNARQLPEFALVQSKFEAMMKDLGKTLGLSEHQIYMQRILGAAFHYAQQANSTSDIFSLRVITGKSKRLLRQALVISQ